MSREREYSRERDERREAPPAEAPNEAFKVFVGGIPYSIDDGKLMDAFREFDASEAKVMMDRMTGRSRGFGFVWFRDKRGLDEAVDKMHNSELDGRRISVARAVPQSETAPGTPADLLRRGQPYPREGGGRYDRGPRYGGGGGGSRYDDRYSRDYRGGGGGYGGDYRGGGGGGYGGYDSYGGYGDRGGYGGYDRAAYPDYRSGYGGYDRGTGYGGYGGYDYRGSDPYASGGYYDDRYRNASYGADRAGHDRGGRPGPYDRPPAR